MIKDEIEIILDLKISELTKINQEKFLQQISLLVQDTKLVIKRIFPHLHSGKIFYCKLRYAED